MLLWLLRSCSRGLLAAFLLRGSGMGGMGSGWLHLRFIHRGGVGFVEGGAFRHNPDLIPHSAGTTGHDLNAAGINSLLVFTRGQVSLGVHSALRRQVLALLFTIGLADDDCLGVGVLLQAVCNLIQNGLGGVIDAGVVFLEGDFIQLAGLRRWWRHLNVDCGRAWRRETTVVAASRADIDGPRGSAGGIEGGSISASRNLATAGGPITERDRAIVWTLTIAGNGRGLARLHARRICRAGNGWWILRRLFHYKLGVALRAGLFAAAGFGGDGVVTRGQSSGIHGAGSFRAG